MPEKSSDLAAPAKLARPGISPPGSKGGRAREALTILVLLLIMIIMANMIIWPSW